MMLSVSKTAVPTAVILTTLPMGVEAIDPITIAVAGAAGIGGLAFLVISTFASEVGKKVIERSAEKFSEEVIFPITDEKATEAAKKINEFFEDFKKTEEEKDFCQAIRFFRMNFEKTADVYRLRAGVELCFQEGKKLDGLYEAYRRISNDKISLGLTSTGEAFIPISDGIAPILLKHITEGLTENTFSPLESYYASEKVSELIEQFKEKFGFIPDIGSIPEYPEKEKVRETFELLNAVWEQVSEQTEAINEKIEENFERHRDAALQNFDEISRRIQLGQYPLQNF